jgi:hypothetical protein
MKQLESDFEAIQDLAKQHAQPIGERLMELFGALGARDTTYWQGVVDAETLARMRSRVDLPHLRLAWPGDRRRMPVLSDRSHSFGVIQMIAFDRGISIVRALLELARAADLLSEANYRQLMRQIDPDDAPEHFGTTPVSDCIFRERGSMFQLRFYSEQAEIKVSRGLARIARLLAEPHRQISSVILGGGDPIEAVEIFGRDGVLDAEAIGDLRRRLAEAEEDRARAKETGDNVQLMVAEEEIEYVRTALREATGLGGRLRELGGEDEVGKSTAKVWKSISRALKVFEGNGMPELAAHLDRSLSKDDGSITYAPSGRVPEWVLT